MNLTVTQTGKWKTLKPSESRLDAYISEDFKRLLVDELADGTRYLLLDLSGVEFMDSSGLSAVIYCLQRMDGGKIALAGAQEAVALMLRLTHIDKVFQLVDRVEDVLTETPA